MKQTSLCYLERDDQYLMLHRTVKKNDENKDKWIGIGGKFEEGESPEDCVCREFYEETGLTIENPTLCGIKQFQTDEDARYVVLFYKTNKFFKLFSISSFSAFAEERIPCICYFTNTDAHRDINLCSKQSRWRIPIRRCFMDSIFHIDVFRSL